MRLCKRVNGLNSMTPSHIGRSTSLAVSTTWPEHMCKPTVMNAVLGLLHFPVFMSYSMSPLPHSHPPNPTSKQQRQDEGSANICCAATVSGCGAGHMSQQWKIIVIGSPSQQLAWYGWMAERLSLTLSTQQQPKPQLSVNTWWFYPRTRVV